MEKMVWTPKQLLEVSGRYWISSTLHAAVDLDLFTALGQGWHLASAISKKMRCDQRALRMFLNALCAMNLLQKKGEKFANTAVSKSFLSKKSAQYLGHMIGHHHHLLDSWSKLSFAVKSGKGVRTRAHFDKPKVLESFLMGMFNMGMQQAPAIASLVDLKKRTRLLDLGGGPGTYAIHFCLKNPLLHGTVFDRHSTRPFAESTIKKFNLARRVKFCPGDFLSDQIPGTYDVAWLSHILHGENPVAAQRIVDKAVGALEHGGLILIHEFILNDDMQGPLFPALFSLNMLLGSNGGQSYSNAQLTGMLKSAGVTKIRRLSFRGPNDSGIIMGIKA